MEINLLVAGIDRRDDGAVGTRRDMRGGKRRQCGQADRRLGGGKRNAARGGNSDPQSGEAARPDSHRNAIEIGKLAARRIHHARDERHHGLGVTAHHAEGFARENRAAMRIEHGSRAGSKRGVDGKNSHDGQARAPSRDEKRIRLAGPR